MRHHHRRVADPTSARWWTSRVTVVPRRRRCERWRDRRSLRQRHGGRPRVRIVRAVRRPDRCTSAGPALDLDPPVTPPAWAISNIGAAESVPFPCPTLRTSEPVNIQNITRSKIGRRAGGMGESRQAKSEGATGHPIRASARTKDDVCDDDKVAVMQAPTCESSTLKRVGINAIKTELRAAATGAVAVASAST